MNSGIGGLRRCSLHPGRKRLSRLKPGGAFSQSPSRRPKPRYKERDVEFASDRQPRRDRPPYHWHRTPSRHPHCRSDDRGGSHMAALARGRLPCLARGGAGGRQLSLDRPDDRGRACHRGRGDSSGLRISFGERRVRRSSGGSGAHLRWAAARGDPQHGLEVRRQAAGGARGRAGRSGLWRRSAGGVLPQTEGLRARLPGSDQGGRRRRWARHAPCCARYRVRRRARPGKARGAFRLRRRPGADRALPGELRATSKCKSSPTGMATSCISSSAIARSSAGIRR